MDFKHLLLWGIFFLVKFPSSLLGQNSAETYSNQVFLTWNEVFLELERVAPGYRPVQSARALGYIGLGAYEAVVHGMPENNSLRSSFPDLALPNPQPAAEYYHPASVNAVYHHLLTRFFAYLQNTRPTQYNLIQSTYATLNQDFGTRTSPDVLSRSQQYGQAVAEAIWQWEIADSAGHDVHLNAQPLSYSPPTGQGLWQPTKPDFSRALYPYSGDERYFALPDSAKICAPPHPYSESPDSPYFLDALEVYNEWKKISENQPGTFEARWVGEFWSDDFLVLTYSAVGRQIALANQLVKKENLSLAQAAELYAQLGMSLNDVGLAMWKSKYFYNVERPIDYIPRVLSQIYPDAVNFTTNMNNPLAGAVGLTPPFPGHPSGHAGFGAVGSAVFSAVFEKNGDYAFIDSTHFDRTEFIGTPRAYSKLTELGEENALSRIYLGVHFRKDCDEGLNQGRVATNAILGLPWKKPSCNSIAITQVNGKIQISNFSAPKTIIQVFNTANNYEVVFSCAGNCATDVQEISDLPTGQYFVKVDLLTSDWQPICKKEESVSISSGNSSNCDALNIATTSNAIIVSGLAAPITLVQVFNPQWQLVFKCAGDCAGNQQTIPNLPAGNYYVQADLLNASWQKICSKNQYIAVTGGNSVVLTLEKPSDITVTAPQGANSMVVSYPIPSAVTTCTNATVSLSRTAGLATGSAFPVGTTAVCYRASDACGEVDSVCFEVTVLPAQTTNLCDAINITTTANTITVSNNTAPRKVIQVYDQHWNLVSKCVGDCAGSSYSVPNLSAGTYYVEIDLLDTNWASICKKNQFVQVSNSGTGAPDCVSIGIVGGLGTIQISNLAAPIIIIQAFDANWAAVYSCLGNCPANQQLIEGLAAGRYFVKVDYLTNTWQSICKKETFVEVNPAVVPLQAAAMVFRAKKSETKVQLSWILANTTPIDYFTVERKTANTDDWTEILRMESDDIDQSAALTGNFTDENPLSGLNQYRIRIFTASGDIRVSLVETVRFFESLSTYPNPAFEKFYVTLKPEAEPNLERLRLMDPLGKVQRDILMGDKPSEITEISVQDLPSGVYFLEIYRRNQRTEIRKIAVERP